MDLGFIFMWPQTVDTCVFNFACFTEGVQSGQTGLGERGETGGVSMV